MTQFVTVVFLLNSGTGGSQIIPFTRTSLRSRSPRPQSVGLTLDETGNDILEPVYRIGETRNQRIRYFTFSIIIKTGIHNNNVPNLLFTFRRSC